MRDDNAGRYRLISSRGVQRAGATSSPRKFVSIAPGETLTLCRVAGAGRFVRLWFTLPVWGQRNALKDAVLRMYWDDEIDPSVDVPLGDFCGAAFGKPARLVSDRLLVVGGAYVSHFEMPFNSGAVIELRNDSHRSLNTLFYQLGYYEEPERTQRAPTFHAEFRREHRTTPAKPFVVLNASGEGHLAGIRVDLQARDWWLRPPLSEIPLPRGFGLGILEGWEEIIVDGDTENALSGTGAEDYFSGGFYFQGAPFCTPTYGCTLRNFFSGRVSAYRFHERDPIHFKQSIRVTLDHGLLNSMTGDYSAVAYWYQHEPHSPRPPLPDPQGRRATFPWLNPVQWILLVAMPATLVAAALYLLAWS